MWEELVVLTVGSHTEVKNTTRRKGALQDDEKQPAAHSSIESIRSTEQAEKAAYRSGP